MISRAPFALAVVCAAALAGCSASGSSSSSPTFSGEAKNVATAISNIQSDAQGGNATRICNSDLASAVVSRLLSSDSGQGCSSIISKQLNEIDNFDLTPVANGITVTGTTATARVKDTSAGKTHFDTLQFVKQGSAWKLSALLP